MSDEDSDKSQKTEAPSARKLEEAHKRGQVVYSREITNWVVFFTATLLIAMMGPGMMRDISASLKMFIEQSHALPADGNGLRLLVNALFIDVAGTLALPLLILVAASIASSLAQTGPLLTFDPIKPDLSKISIFKGFERLFSKRSLMELAKGIFKLLLVSIAAVIALMPYFDTVEHFVGLDFDQSMLELVDLFVKMMTAVLIVLFVLAIADYLYQRHEFMEKLRMSKQELKDEYKQTEGDPVVKGKLRQLREQKARERMIQSIPEADVVITNPTHFAVALKYDTKSMDAPTMIAKGADQVAQRIKEAAREHKVPVIENPSLARTLYDAMEINQMIPGEHYKAVAEVISYVFKLKGKKL